MPKISEKELLVKIQVNRMIEYLVDTLKYSYQDALSIILGSETYHQLLSSETYLNQGTLYVLDDFKEEISTAA